LSRINNTYSLRERIFEITPTFDPYFALSGDEIENYERIKTKTVSAQYDRVIIRVHSF